MPRPIAPPTLVRLRILAWHARPALGVVALLIACATVVRLTDPPPPPTVPTVVAARDVTAGAELTAADLRITAVPRPLVPDGAAGLVGAANPGDHAAKAALTDLIGRRVAVDVPRGLTVVESLLEGARFGVQPPAGTVVVPVRLDAATVVRLLRPGDLVDLVAPQEVSWAGTVPDASVPEGLEQAEGSMATAGTQPQVLARRALVLDVGGGPDDRKPTAGLTDLTPSRDGDPVALVAVTPEEGRLLAAAAARDVLGAVLVE